MLKQQKIKEQYELHTVFCILKFVTDSKSKHLKAKPERRDQKDQNTRGKVIRQKIDKKWDTEAEGHSEEKSNGVNREIIQS